jgi:phosphate transport system permease protein
MNDQEKNWFQKKADRANRIARILISIGGYGVIVSIVGILLFLFYQSIPLFFSASVKKTETVDVEHTPRKILLTGIDQYQEIVYILDDSGIIRFVRLADQKVIALDSLPLSPGERLLTANKGSLEEHLFATGSTDGRIFTGEIRFRPQYRGSQRIMVPSFEFEGSFTTVNAGDSLPAHIERLLFRKNDDGIELWSWVDHQGRLFAKLYDPDTEQAYLHSLSESLGRERVSRLTATYNEDKLICGTLNGELFWFDLSRPDKVFLKDNWKVSQSTISALQFLIGDNALVIGDTDGAVQVWFPVRQEDNKMKFLPIRQFSPHPAPVIQAYASPRNRSFLTIDAGGGIHLNYSTTDKTELEFRGSPYPVLTASFSPKSNGIILADSQDRLGTYLLSNRYPEITLQTLFGKVWYEGYPKPEFVWQSTGGSDEFEPKLSLIPLIFGTIKGTIYAMFFSIPLAILAAIYVSQFAPKWLARIVKPTVEVMAALPSVVIGFLAGLYFSPIVEKHLMTVFLFLIFLPIIFLVSIAVWRIVPEQKRARVPMGWEIIFIIPVIAATILLIITIAHSVEMILFDGNIKQWLYSVMGMVYDQRNSMVVGFALGFAVIPIIFTISEDALSNVPESLTSASLALGASRWQTVRRVILPAAAGGIFAAVMLGLGRAIGETMIVLMATGNTPIMSISPFNGFRAMSACIAVEIPEAPVGGTLYRVLFLTALLLFIFTFLINSLSALIGDRLRKKYARF